MDAIIEREEPGLAETVQRTRRAWDMNSDHADQVRADMVSDHVSVRVKLVGRVRSEALVAAAQLPAASGGTVSCG